MNLVAAKNILHFFLLSLLRHFLNPAPLLRGAPNLFFSFFSLSQFQTVELDTLLEKEVFFEGKEGIFCVGGWNPEFGLVGVERMKIQCNVCEAAEAKVLCCADEAGLCWECDEKVHAANKLASKHQRVPLSTSSSHMPKCDICQEALGYFFCLEDRALLCRKCDVAIHTANAYVSGHQRFLLTGVRVGLEATDPGASSTSLKSDSGEKVSDSSVSRKVSTAPQPSNYNEVLPAEVGGVGEFPSAKVSFGGGSTAGNISQWTIDEFIGLNEFSQNYDYMEGSSRSSDSSFVIDCVY
ncbi:hypothetical protein AAZX31_12G224000 [Glycine max]|uniref:B-box zinc finger protein 22-like isoform X2 n=1 Tax=Glycine soja TaxID=3848 RepID=UPI00103FA350|nr:B-box zinc finger protein 22-like isoform X2 [Glycine soja]